MPPRVPPGAHRHLATRATSASSWCRPARIPHPSHRSKSSWAAAVDQAKTIVKDQLRPLSAASSSSASATTSSSPAGFFGASPSSSSPSPSSSSQQIITDPLSLVSSELASLRSNVSSLLGSGHPGLNTIAKYYFQAEGKHVRPLIVLLMSKATNGLSPLWPELLDRAQRTQPSSKAEAGKTIEREMGIDEPLSPASVLNDFNPHMESIEGTLSSLQQSASTVSSASSAATETAILPTQRRLAEITEMIHVASLLHDDVIDASPLRRGAPSAPSEFGNKLSILGGDFLLGRASVALARLRDNEVVELLATVLANLVEGEVMQLKSQAAGEATSAGHWDREGLAACHLGLAPGTPVSQVGPTPAHFSIYLQKTYLKTAALIGKSTRASTILGGCSAEAISRAGFGADVQEHMRKVRDAAYDYGRNLGVAFQVRFSRLGPISVLFFRL